MIKYCCCIEKREIFSSQKSQEDNRSSINMSPEKDEVCETIKTPNFTTDTDVVRIINEDESMQVINQSNQSTRREKRLASPSIDFPIDVFGDAPLSPSSSSSVDATFEPSIDMMVNDFDDEQTLNEEEALAGQEAHNVQDEIDTLREESEMPIDELLAKYGAMVPAESQQKKSKSKKNKKKIHKNTSNHKAVELSVTQLLDESEAASPKRLNINDDSNSVDSYHDTDEEEIDKTEFASNPEVRRQHRSHLLDLYPESTLASLLPVETNKVSLYDEANEDEELDEYAETLSDYRKSVMVGSEFQANIPEGLSKYGDILPYENEDKLIWEPSQVSEKEVEEYLVKIRNIKSTTTDSEQMDKEGSGKTEMTATMMKEKEGNSSQNICDEIIKLSGESNGELNTVKDDEQALHLLVQCGYDFKEALRRKTLNVLPLTGTMSLWSEEECQKFEEGIRKFGKDFLKIRQQYVRTRSMREIVQFYYIWKKSERSDQNFTNSDTVDHMDIYLNESSDYGANNALGGSFPNQFLNGAACGKKSGTNNARNFSIMTKNAPTNNNKLNSNRRHVSLQDNSFKDDSPVEHVDLNLKNE